MRRLLIAAIVALLGTVPAAAQGVSPSLMSACTFSKNYDASTNGNTLLITADPVKTVYPCGWNIMTGGTVSVQFIYGTSVSTPCDTGSTPITPAFQMTAGIPQVDHLPVYTGVIAAPPGKDVCIKVGSGTAAQAIFYYARF